ncbi:MAG TPA: nucleotidyltransferase domain-containing protein [Leadbetterella sp.]|jgi:predicted nucleotidyltransferase|nr:nucleotidyltransferase domain-containing protein [Leadbetterella sp.]
MEKLIVDNLAQIKHIFKEYGAESAFLFGSAAINNLEKESDIDFLFSFPVGMHYETYANNYFGLMDSLEKLLKREVDLVAEKTLKNPYLIEKINSQKIRIL